MLFNINMGHCLRGADTGTSGLNGLREEVLTREYGYALGKEFQNRGHKVNYSFCDEAKSLGESLRKQVAMCEKVKADLNICLHFNSTSGGFGTEIYTHKGKYMVEADRVLKEMEKLGFKNRGIKYQGLSLIQDTTAPTIYVEVCFIDSAYDVSLLQKNGPKSIARAIANGVLNQQNKPINASKPKPTPKPIIREDNKMDKELVKKQLYSVECSINSVMANLYTELDKLKVDLKAVQDLKEYINKSVEG